MLETLKNLTVPLKGENLNQYESISRKDCNLLQNPQRLHARVQLNG